MLAIKSSLEPKQQEKGKLLPSNIIAKLPINEGILLFYFAEKPFTLKALLFNKNDPEQIIWRSKRPIWQSDEKIQPKKITLDKRIVTLHFKVEHKYQAIMFPLTQFFDFKPQKKLTPLILRRIPTNPILEPRTKNGWESLYVFNSAALYLDDKVHFLYRAIGDTGLSVLGYAASRDGIHIDERSNVPVYACNGVSSDKNSKQRFSPYAYASGGSWYGCEDPRLTRIGDKIYMTYTTFSHWGKPPGIALTAIRVNDFLNKQWLWQPPRLISAPNEMHKNWVIFPDKIDGKFAILHSISPNLLVDYYETLDFDNDTYVDSYYQSSGRTHHWDNWVRGIGPPPIKTTEGWLVLYHAMDNSDPNRYKIGAMILDAADPTIMRYRSSSPLLQPDAHYENEGHKTGVVYSCGAVVLDERLFVYYGGADTVVCAAYINLNQLIEQLKSCETLAFEQSQSMKSHTGNSYV